MKKVIFLFIFLLTIKNPIFANNDFGIIAKVNDKIITQYDLNNYIKIFQLYFKSNNNVNEKVKREILNSLIENILMEDAIKNENIDFDEEDFKYYYETAIQKDKPQENNINIKAYQRLIKINYMWNKLVETRIRSRVSVSNSEVYDSLEYLSENPIRVRYNISQITIYKNNNSDPKTIINKLYEEIKNKNNFETVAEKLSQDNRAAKGYMGWVDEMDINKEIYNAIKSLQVGSITKPLYFGDEDSGYYMIIKLNDKKEEKVAKNNDINRVKYFIYNQKLNLEVKNYIDELYNSAFIEIYL